MTDSLRALLTGVIDYAGLFPPATLPLEQAIRNYARYRTEAESWMLGKFICPADNLEQVSQFAPELFMGKPTLRLSVLVGGGSTSDEFESNLRRQLNHVKKFETRHLPTEAMIDSYEVRLPTDWKDLHLVLLKEKLIEFGSTCYLELPQQELIQVVVTDINAGDQTIQEYSFQFGETWFHMDSNEAPLQLKLRCGGIDASAFPTARHVGMVIATSRFINTSLKFTAGLHHAIRHLDAGLQVTMHGFINVFVAGVLAHARQLSEEQLCGILEDEDAASFRFDDRALHWRDLSATLAEITAARRFVTSFGSCSFDEPRDDLRQLGWL